MTYRGEGRKERKGRGGRPKAQPEDVRRMTIGVRVNAAEWQALQDRARHMGMNPAQWLRAAALSRRLPPPPVPETNRAAYAELARLSVNLNQLVRATHEGRADVSPNILLGLRKEVLHLQAMLVGVAQEQSA